VCNKRFKAKITKEQITNNKTNNIQHFIFFLKKHRLCKTISDNFQSIYVRAIFRKKNEKN